MSRAGLTRFIHQRFEIAGNPEAYFTDALTRFVDNGPNSRLAELLPWAWDPDAG